VCAKYYQKLFEICAAYPVEKGAVSPENLAEKGARGCGLLL
jgi:hypothetical protein